MTRSQQRLQRVLALARRAPSAAPRSQAAAEVPFGFATRVTARWLAHRHQPSVADLWERLGQWGASVTLGICLVAAAYHQAQPEPGVFDALMDAPMAVSKPI